MAEIKITKKMKYEQIIAILNGEPILDEHKDMLVEFCTAEIDRLDRKREKSGESAPTKEQIENARLAEIVYGILVSANGAPLTFKEIRDENEELRSFSSQKMTALMKVLGDRVVKFVDKKITYFKIADATEVVEGE